MRRTFTSMALGLTAAVAAAGVMAGVTAGLAAGSPVSHGSSDPAVAPAVAPAPDRVRHGALLAVDRAGHEALPVPAALARPPDTPTVVLLHGLGRTHHSMGALADALEDAGYRVVNPSYPSRHRPVRELADSLARELDRCCAGESGPIHFVTHSLGGILVRVYQATHGADRIGRVVMLSPPNRGSEVVDRLPDGLLELVLGPAVLELGTDSAGLVHELPPVAFELGIITGNASLNPLFSWWLPGEDDGKVTVSSARLEGAAAFLVVPYSHTWIMRRDQVIEEVLSFLETGAFRERAPESR